MTITDFAFDHLYCYYQGCSLAFRGLNRGFTGLCYKVDKNKTVRMKILKSLLFSFQEQDRDTEDYNNDGEGEEWDPIEDEAGSTSRPIVGVTPSAFTRLDTRDPIDFIDPIAATNERPRILDDCKLLTNSHTFHFHPLQDVLLMLSVAPSHVKCSQDYTLDLYISILD